MTCVPPPPAPTHGMNTTQISHFRIDFVSKPQLGSDVPVEVRAELEINLNRLAPHIRSEWDSLREHDIIFLMSVTEAKKQGGDGPDVAGSTRKDVARQLRVRDSVVSIRGAEVVQVLDEAGKLMNDFSDGDSRGKSPAGTKRVIRVQLDPAQYFKDATSNNLAVYEGFNIVVSAVWPPAVHPVTRVCVCVFVLVYV